MPKKTSAQLDREIAEILARGGTGFRSFGSEGDPWPAWLRAFGTACGVYAIKSSGRVVYVGSSKRRLYDTITRHFQQWKRSKNWWKGAYGAGHDPGLVYMRGRCEVAVQTCPCGSELELEADWIERYLPRDNLVENPDGAREDAPF